MHSIPPATMIFLCPHSIAYEAIMTDFIPLAHTLLTSVAGVSRGIIDPIATYLAGAYPIPAWSTAPI